MKFVNKQTKKEENHKQNVIENTVNIRGKTGSRIRKILKIKIET